MQRWIEQLKAARSEPERDEILLRSFEETLKLSVFSVARDRAIEDVRDQMRALADLALRS